MKSYLEQRGFDLERLEQRGLLCGDLANAAFGEEPGQGLNRLRRLLHRKSLRRLIEQ